MRLARRSSIFLLSASLSASILLSAARASGQDSPSLGDVARQTRMQKAQKDASSAASSQNGQSPDAQTQAATGPSGTAPLPTDAASGATKQDATNKLARRVITNDEIPEHFSPVVSHSSNSLTSNDDSNSDPQSAPIQAKGSGEQWKTQIENAKIIVANLQQNINQMSASIQYAGANCVANCAQWNEHQKQKQDQVDSMKGQLESAEKNLEDLQDAARKQGFGTSITDP